MKTRTSYIHSLRKKEKIGYFHYRLALAIYTKYKKENWREAKLPVDDFRNSVLKKERRNLKLKQSLVQYLSAIAKAITANVFFLKKKHALLVNK